MAEEQAPGDWPPQHWGDTLSRLLKNNTQFWGTDSDPHACRASPPLAAPSPQSTCCYQTDFNCSHTFTQVTCHLPGSLGIRFVPQTRTDVTALVSESVLTLRWRKHQVQGSEGEREACLYHPTTRQHQEARTFGGRGECSHLGHQQQAWGSWVWCQQFREAHEQSLEWGADGISWRLDVTGIPFNESSHPLSQNFIIPPAKEAPRTNRGMLFWAARIDSQTLHYNLRQVT